MSSVVQPQSPRRMSVAEYLAFEERAQERHAYHRGEIFAMAGGSPTHSRLKFQLVMVLGEQIRNSGCQGFDSDMRVKIEEIELYTYPDAAVTCAHPQFTTESPKSLLNPQAIFEVLSKSSEAYDRGQKFAQYRLIPALRHYVLVSQARKQVEVFSRDDEGQWSIAIHDHRQPRVRLPAIGCELSLDELYAEIELQPAEEHRQPEN